MGIPSRTGEPGSIISVRTGQVGEMLGLDADWLPGGGSGPFPRTLTIRASDVAVGDQPAFGVRVAVSDGSVQPVPRLGDGKRLMEGRVLDRLNRLPAELGVETRPELAGFCRQIDGVRLPNVHVGRDGTVRLDNAPAQAPRAWIFEAVETAADRPHDRQGRRS